MSYLIQQQPISLAFLLVSFMQVETFRSDPRKNGYVPRRLDIIK